MINIKKSLILKFSSVLCLSTLIICTTSYKVFSKEFETFAASSLPSQNVPPIILPNNINKCIYASKTNKAYLLSENAKDIFVLDLLKNRIINTIHRNSKVTSLALSYDEKKLYIGNSDTTKFLSEYTLSTNINKDLSNTNLDLTSSPKKIYCTNNRIFIIGNDTSHTLKVIDSKTLKNIKYGTLVKNLESFTISNDNKYFYGTFKSSDKKNIIIRKYLINNNLLIKKDEITIAQSNFKTSKTDLPIILAENDKLFIYKDKIFNTENLSTYTSYFDADILGMNAAENLLIGPSIVYLLSYNYALSYGSDDYKNILISKDGVIYMNYKDGIMPLRALPGDLNGDTTCDTNDIASIAASYNLTSKNPKYNVMIDLNSDGIIDLQDLVIVSRQIDDFLQN